MSIDLNWETLTTGPDGEALAHSIRDFIHTKFQSVPLPRFIKSVTVHDFEFGATPPELELKDITDPLPDFYEENSDADDDDDDSEEEKDQRNEAAAHNNRLQERSAGIRELRAASERRGHVGSGLGPTGARLSAIPPYISTGIPGGHMRGLSLVPQDLGSPFLGTSTPGIPGGTSNLNYFHSHLTGGLSGTQTPLAAVAGAQLGNNNNNNNNHHHQHRRPEADSGSPLSVSTSAFPGPARRHVSPDSRAPSHSRNPSQGSVSVADSNPNLHHHHGGVPGPFAANYPNNPALREKSSVSTFAPTASSAGTSRPQTRDNTHINNANAASSSSSAMLAGSSTTAINEDDDEGDLGPDGDGDGDRRRYREPRIEDMQAVFRIRYSGDVRLLLTADILLDYPMPSFVGIPLRLSITGLSFDGVGVVAYIRRRVHFCFLSPEDALAAVGADDDEGAQQAADGGGQTGAGAEAGPSGGKPAGNGKMGGLLQEIRVESEIGQREGGKQSLKNVGKVERFVLEQVRRIFEEEFVYPSFWTFLV